VDIKVFLNECEQLQSIRRLKTTSSMDIAAVLYQQVTCPFLDFDVRARDEVADAPDHHVYNAFNIWKKIIIPPLGNFSSPVSKNLGSSMDIDGNGVRR
jgi:hypothetical protein